MVAIMSGADNGFFYAGQVMHFSSPFTVFLIYHKQVGNSRNITEVSMSKLTDIKNRIDQLDGGAFQNLCDAYLTCRGYGAGYSLGMNTGTNKTAKGKCSSCWH